jgi:hypothetical protein
MDPEPIAAKGNHDTSNLKDRSFIRVDTPLQVHTSTLHYKYPNKRKITGKPRNVIATKIWASDAK